jgi:hypothetical protein
MFVALFASTWYEIRGVMWQMDPAEALGTRSVEGPAAPAR